MLMQYSKPLLNLSAKKTALDIRAPRVHVRQPSLSAGRLKRTAISSEAAIHCLSRANHSVWFTFRAQIWRMLRHCLPLHTLATGEITEACLTSIRL